MTKQQETVSSVSLSDLLEAQAVATEVFAQTQSGNIYRFWVSGKKLLVGNSRAQYGLGHDAYSDAFTAESFDLGLATRNVTVGEVMRFGTVR